MSALAISQGARRDSGYKSRRFVTATDSVAGLRSKVAPGEMLRAITRTVLLVQAAASSSMKRVEEASAAPARSRCWHPVTVTSSRLVPPGAKLGRSQETSAANSRWPTRRVGVPQSAANTP
jgi:hypothetical protein